MDLTKALAKFRRKVTAESWLKSALAGLTVGAGANVLCSFAFLFFGVKMYWISILVFAAVTAAATPLFYYKKYIASVRQVAARVDELGLEERVLTAAQYAEDDSYIARRQREDAMNALRSVNESLLRIAVSVPMVAICAGVFLAGIGTTTASAVVDGSILSSIEQKIEEEEEAKNAVWWNVEYGVYEEEGGYIVGDMIQKIKQGESAEKVEAVADEGYYFVGWSDDCADAIRVDENVKDTIRVYAAFLPIDEGDEADDDDEGTPHYDPSEDKNNNNNNQDHDGPSLPDKNKPEQDGNGDGEGGGSGGSNLANNQILDGATFYGDMYGSALGDANSAMNSSGDMSSGETGAVGGYFSNIAN